MHGHQVIGAHLPMEGGIEAAFKSDLEKSDDPEKLLKEIEARMEMVRSPFRTAESFLAEEIIDPRDTRKLLCEFANLSSTVKNTWKNIFWIKTIKLSQIKNSINLVVYYIYVVLIQHYLILFLFCYKTSHLTTN